MKSKKPPKYVLLLWEQLPNIFEFFLIPRKDLSKENMSLLHKCHGNYINYAKYNTHNQKHTEDEIDEALALLLELVTDPKVTWADKTHRDERSSMLRMSRKEFDKIFGSWFKYRISSKKLDGPIILPYCRFFVSGFIL